MATGTPVLVEGDLLHSAPLRFRRGAIVAAELVDLTLPDLPILVGRCVIEKPCRGPMPFCIALEKGALEDGHLYVLGGRITFNDKVLWFSVGAQRFDPDAARHSIWLDRVARPLRNDFGVSCGLRPATHRAASVQFTPSYRPVGGRMADWRAFGLG